MSHRKRIGPSQWAGKTAVVVGASAGLGRHLAIALAGGGVARLILSARDRARLEETACQIAAAWPNVLVSTCAGDSATIEGAAALAQHIKHMSHSSAAATATIATASTTDSTTASSSLDTVDLLINAVGLSDRGEILKLTPTRLEELVRANVLSPLLVAQSLVPCMARDGVIVHIGSLASHFAPRFLGGYAIAKHALAGLTQQLRLELREQGLHVMLVCPGPIARLADAPPRYSHLPTAGDLPAAALKGGGGAKLAGLDPDQLAHAILQAASERRLELVQPWKARLLIGLMGLWPRLGERILRKMTA